MSKFLKALLITFILFAIVAILAFALAISLNGYPILGIIIFAPVIIIIVFLFIYTVLLE